MQRVGRGAGRGAPDRRPTGRLVPRSLRPPRRALAPGRRRRTPRCSTSRGRSLVVVGAGDTTVGGVLRRSATNGWAQECLPFYELVDPGSFRLDGSKPTRLRWTTTARRRPRCVPPPALPPPALSAVPAPIPARGARRASLPKLAFSWPDEFGAPITSWARRRARGRLMVARPARWAASCMPGLLAVGGLFRLYAVLASPAVTGPAPGAPARPRRAASPLRG